MCMHGSAGLPQPYRVHIAKIFVCTDEQSAIVRARHQGENAMQVIHLQWDGPSTLEEIQGMNNDHDYGVYQVYGSHPVYGSDVLLYIGKAGEQTFSVRLQQEGWHYNQDARNIRYYVGRLAGERTPSDTKWSHQIDMVETLLIHSHWPAANSRNIQTLGSHATEISETHILNWGQRRSLLSEVSGLMLTDQHDDIPNYHVYGDEDNILGV